MLSLRYPYNNSNSLTRVAELRLCTFRRQAAQHLFCHGNSEFIVKLIDLDRVVESTDISAVGGYYGEMYKAPDGAHWSPNRYDWKQLGS